MNNLRTIIIVFIIILSGVFIRFNGYHKTHPDMDENFELGNLNRNMKDPSCIFKRDTMYGDHTSFPGELLLHYIPMKVMGLHNREFTNRDIKAPYDVWKKNDYLRLVSPKIILYLLGILIFVKLTLIYATSRIGLIIPIVLYTFNGQLIFHAFALRPYGVLPELAVFNLYFAHTYFKEETVFNWIFYPILIFFTCIYHAYGILIAGLPVLYCMIRYKKFDLRLAIVLLISSAAWCYYASHSAFGMTPKGIQSIVDPFQHMPREIFPYISQMFGSQLLMIIVLPFLALSLLKKHASSYYLFLFLMILFPMAAIIGIDLKTSYWILPRQWIWVMPWFALFCGMSVDGEG